MSNRKLYEALPLKQWKKDNPDQDWNLMPHSWTADDLCVLVPVEDQWISVEDRLPESGESVLCYRTLGPLSRMVENSWELHTEQNEKWFKMNFSHWRPLPTSPKDTEQLKPE